jgi:hypothetical protein
MLTRLATVIAQILKTNRQKLLRFNEREPLKLLCVQSEHSLRGRGITGQW